MNSCDIFGRVMETQIDRDRQSIYLSVVAQELLKLHKVNLSRGVHLI